MSLPILNIFKDFLWIKLKLLTTVYQSYRNAIAKYHRQGSLNSKNLFPHSSGDWKYKIKLCQSLVSGEDTFPGL
jgi:hypothetical protein